MKRSLAMLLAIMLLLSGCLETPTDTTPVTEPAVETIPKETEPTVSEVKGGLGILDPEEAEASAPLWRYPLTLSDHYAVRPMGKGVLLLSGNKETTLTCLQDDTDPVTVVLTDIHLSVDDPSWVVDTKRIVYYDDIYNEMVELDPSLQEVRRVPMPVDMAHEPVFSADGKCAFYFDEDQELRVLDLQTGIGRLLTDVKTGVPQVIGTCFQDTVIKCVIRGQSTDEYILIDAQNGAVLFRSEQEPELATSDQWYFVPWQDGTAPDLIFGQREGERACFVPEEDGTYVPMPAHGSVVCVSDAEEGCELTLYELSQEEERSRLILPGCAALDLVMDERLDRVWILTESQDGGQTLYGWDPSASVEEAEADFIIPYYTADAPDTEGLARIADEAKVLGDRFGIRIRIHQAALDAQPSDYVFTAEHQVGVYDQYLDLLEQQLQIYPASMLKKLGKSSGNGRLTVVLVRSICGKGEMGALSATEGVQYWKSGSAYLALAMDRAFAQTFHHELFHAIDTYVLAETKAYDFWDSLNPEGFRYDRDYVSNAFRDPEEYLTGEGRAFVDTYSMSFPKEDRARIMEHAVMEGQEEVFASETMQKKLTTLCRGIRSAFGMNKVSEAFLWEQYLEKPLA